MEDEVPVTGRVTGGRAGAGFGGAVLTGEGANGFVLATVAAGIGFFFLKIKRIICTFSRILLSRFRLPPTPVQEVGAETYDMI